MKILDVCSWERPGLSRLFQYCNYYFMEETKHRHSQIKSLFWFYSGQSNHQRATLMTAYSWNAFGVLFLLFLPLPGTRYCSRFGDVLAVILWHAHNSINSMLAPQKHYRSFSIRLFTILSHRLHSAVARHCKSGRGTKHSGAAEIRLSLWCLGFTPLRRLQHWARLYAPTRCGRPGRRTPLL